MHRIWYGLIEYEFVYCVQWILLGLPWCQNIEMKWFIDTNIVPMQKLIDGWNDICH